jgi:hypothetical protein
VENPPSIEHPLSSRLTRGMMPKLGKPSFAWQVCCSAWQLMQALEGDLKARALSRSLLHPLPPRSSCVTSNRLPSIRFYAGVDLHARSLFLVVLDPTGQTRYARNLPVNPQPFRKAIAPFRDGLIVGCECMHCWYWLADTCREDNIPFVLGHAWGMNAVHGSKTKCDRKDAEAIAHLLKGGNFPLAYAYPKERRGLHDLLRARLRLVRQRAKIYGHIHTARRQLNLPPVSNEVKYKSKRAGALADIDALRV